MRDAKRFLKIAVLLFFFVIVTTVLLRKYDLFVRAYQGLERLISNPSIEVEKEAWKEGI